MPKVSVIIPCYNQGQYLGESVQSVLAQTFHDYEIIIVNDGSTDEETNYILSTFSMPKTRIVRTVNQGLAMARNTGITEACGKYILPLDADDKIASTYLEKAVLALDSDAQLGIVYSLARYFGEKDDAWQLPLFSNKKILTDNLIFCSAFFRRQHWEQVGGYNSNMKYGWEDWDFWLSLLELGVTVQRIPEMLFFYRVSSKSMNSSMRLPDKFVMLMTLIGNHKGLYSRNFGTVLRGLVTPRAIRLSLE